jgi:hypothetical protein
MQEMKRVDVAGYFGDQYARDMRYCLCPDEPAIKKAWEAYQEANQANQEATEK